MSTITATKAIVVLLSEPVLFSDNSKKQESSHEGQHYVYDQHVLVLLWFAGRAWPSRYVPDIYVGHIMQ